MPARFTFVTYYWSPYRSGLTLHVARIAEALAAAGHHVEALVARHDRALADRETIAGVQVRRLAVAARFDRAVMVPGMVPAAATAAGRSDVVVVVTPLAEAAPLALAAKARAQVAVYHICDPQLPPSRLSGAVMAVADASARAAVRMADLVVASSADYAAHSRILRAARRQIVAIPPPVDLGAFDRPATESPPSGGPGRVGYLGRLTHEKGLDRLIRAIATMNPQPELLLAGDSAGVAGGGEGMQLRQLAADLGVSARFLGPLADSELAGFYRSLDVFALPSVSSLEAWGMVQVEAMLSGTPVVASALPGVREVLGAAGMGIGVPAGDVPALARALAVVLESPESFERPRDRVIAALRLDTAVSDHVAQLETLAGVGRRSGL